jgi:dUTP pyrophosphatase
MIKKRIFAKNNKNNMKVKIINKSNNELPTYETSASAGLDLRAFIPETITLLPLERNLIQTGLFLEIPEGYEAQVRPRSGLAIKNGITVLNAPGTIDADYRGEIGVILVNISQDNFEINTGDRIAQLIFAKVKQAKWILTEELSETERGEGGFGSTGKN